MVAFSCCVYDGGVAERIEMESIREKGWGDKFKRKGRVDEPGLNRINGRCPMTPLEVSFWYSKTLTILLVCIFEEMKSSISVCLGIDLYVHILGCS